MATILSSTDVVMDIAPPRPFTFQFIRNDDDSIKTCAETEITKQDEPVYHYTLFLSNEQFYILYTCPLTRSKVPGTT